MAGVVPSAAIPGGIANKAPWGIPKGEKRQPQSTTNARILAQHLESSSTIKTHSLAMR